jgi:2-polyprenyl-3-methyl-5-hydroxy-6-metoxy-1,4-benzoquinol methylase
MKKYDREKWEDYANTHLLPTTRDTTKNIVLKFFGRGRILDVGAGDGALSSFLSSQNGMTVIPTEISLARCKRMRQWGLGPILCDSLFLPFKSECFDYIISDNVIEHVPDGKKFLAEQYRVCKWNGRIITLTPNRFAPTRFLATIYINPKTRKWSVAKEFPIEKLDPTHTTEQSLRSFKSLLDGLNVHYKIFGVPSFEKWYWTTFWNVIPLAIKKHIKDFVWKHPLLCRGFVGIIEKK